MRPFAEWLETNSRKTRSRVILAPDMLGPYPTRVRRAAELVSKVSGAIIAVKVNWQILLPYGVLGLGPLVDACESAGLPLIADVKLNDIGSTNEEVADILFSNGFAALIANPFVGKEGGVGEVMERAHRAGKGVVLLVYMSHLGAKEGYGLRVGGKPLYIRFAERALDWRADAVVVSAKSPKIIRDVRKMVGSRMVIMSPGVGAQGGDARLAVRAGADYVIVGRSIAESKSPIETARAINESVDI